MSRSPLAHDHPPATRGHAPGWRDPRLWVGVALVAVSVVVGARVVGAADDTVEVWAVATDLGAGDSITADDLVVRRVRFADPAQLATYFAADDPLPADASLRRGVGAGEILPRAAVGAAADGDALQLPVAVDAAQVPPSVRAGTVVDVHVAGPTDERATHRPGRPVLSAVTVVDAPPLDAGLAVSGQRQLVVSVSEAEAAAFLRVVGTLDAPVVTVVRRG